MLMRWDPFFDSNRYYDRVFRAALEPSRSARPANAAAVPAADIRETESEFVISMEVPGIAREDISVEVDGRVLSVRGERKVQSEEGASERRVERFRGAFARTFHLPESADADAIAASLRDGVLELKIPKRVVQKARKVDVLAA